jgi:hypothetical protein
LGVIIFGLLEEIFLITVSAGLIVLWTAGIGLTLPVYLYILGSKNKTESKKDLHLFLKNRFPGKSITEIPEKDKAEAVNWYRRIEQSKEKKIKFC